MQQDLQTVDYLPVPIVYIFSISSLFYDPPRITFSPFSHVDVSWKQLKFTKPVHEWKFQFYSKLRQEKFKARIASRINRTQLSSPKDSSNTWCNSHVVVSKWINHNMADENGFGDVNGKAEVEERASENGEVDEDEKGNLSYQFVICDMVKKIELHELWAKCKMLSYHFQFGNLTIF